MCGHVLVLSTAHFRSPVYGQKWAGDKTRLSLWGPYTVHAGINIQRGYTVHKGNMEYLYTIHYRKYKVYIRAVLAREFFMGIKYTGVPETCDIGYVF